MAVDQLPGRVREFAGYLDGLLARLDQGEGWSGVFWQRDPEGMRACLDGREVPPWDVVAALLDDLAAAYGTAAADAERERARALYRAALAAYDTRPGAREALADRLDVMLREQRYAADRQAELTRLLSAGASGAEADALRLDLAWAHDDYVRASARCDELRGRLAALHRRATGNQAGAVRGPSDAGLGRPLAADSGQVEMPRRGDAGAERVASGGVHGRGRGSLAGESGSVVPVSGDAGSVGVPVRGDAGSGWGVVRGGLGAERGSSVGESGSAGAPLRGEAGAERVVPRGDARSGQGPAAGGSGPEQVGPRPGSGQDRGARLAGSAPAQGPLPTGSLPAQASGPAAAPVARPHSTEPPASHIPPTAPPPPAPTAPANSRKRRRGSARFAGMAEDTAASAAVPQVSVPSAPLSRGARFAGGVEQPVEAEPVNAEEVDADAGVAVAGAVEQLARLRTEGRTGEAHVLLVEVAQWPPARFPLLVDALHRAGLGADWATLLWEAASLPAERLVGVADALVAAGRDADGRQLLRQGVARPAEQVGAAVLRLEGAGRQREARALLDACVRARAAEEAARSVLPDPLRLVPLLLDAARAVSEERYWDLVHALRVAGHGA
ncbi:hypothetical protein ACH47Z_20645 [Streptomyces sp. NPDC020192]|uniref:hypothetical protein n=1 Tax=Streptomyces sp. NPDC020192 TaxID=3365066 RepID=UPI00378D19AD